MRKALLYIPIILLLTSCGGEEEKTEPTVVSGGTETSHTKETVVNNPMDSAIMSEYMKLTKQMQKVDSDSLKFELESLAANNDSLLKVIAAMKTTIDESLPVKFPEPDTKDYNVPPYGDTDEQKYFVFEAMIPEKGKALDEFPKSIRGSYAKPDNAQIVIGKNDIMYTSADGKEQKIFNISTDQKCTQSGDFYLLQYNSKDGWVVVTIELKNGNLSFRIIPKGAKIATKPTKKELKKFFEEAKLDLYQVYAKVK